MPAILAQMRGDAVSSRLDGNLRRAQRIGPRSTPRVAQRRDMIDVHSET